jgi:hypothetical protein
MAGSTFTATAGTVSNGSIASRVWTLNGTIISTGATATPASAGTLTYRETATGAGGSTDSAVQSVTVTSSSTSSPTPNNTYANSTQVRANNSAFSDQFRAMETQLNNKGA